MFFLYPFSLYADINIITFRLSSTSFKAMTKKMHFLHTLQGLKSMPRPASVDRVLWHEIMRSILPRSVSSNRIVGGLQNKDDSDDTEDEGETSLNAAFLTPSNWLRSSETRLCTSSRLEFSVSPAAIRSTDSFVLGLAHAEELLRIGE